MNEEEKSNYSWETEWDEYAEELIEHLAHCEGNSGDYYDY